MPTKRIPKEIREEILSKARTGEKVSDLANRYGISSKTIYNWLTKDSGEDTVSVLKYNKLKRENEELKRIIGKLTLEMSWEKKAKLALTSTCKAVVAMATPISHYHLHRVGKQLIKDQQLKQAIEETWE